MKKPIKKKVEYLDFSECTNFIEKKYKIDTRDYAKYHSQFSDWCKERGYKIKYPANFSIDGEAKIRGEQFNKEISDKIIIERPYQDFWHFLLRRFGLSNGSDFELSKEDLEGEEAAMEIWQKEIIKLYLKEFGGKDGRAEFRVEW